MTYNKYTIVNFRYQKEIVSQEIISFLNNFNRKIYKLIYKYLVVKNKGATFAARKG